LLGSGAFGEVKLCTHKKLNEKRAVKIVGIVKKKKKEIEMMQKEINILKDMDHPNVVKLYESYKSRKKFYIVTELLTGGELFDWIVN